jgi:hypothetical protein
VEPNAREGKMNEWMERRREGEDGRIGEGGKKVYATCGAERERGENE